MSQTKTARQNDVVSFWLNLIIDVSFGVDYVFLRKSRGGRGGGWLMGWRAFFKGWPWGGLRDRVCVGIRMYF